MENIIMYGLPMIIGVYVTALFNRTEPPVAKNTSESIDWMSDHVPERFQSRLDKYFYGMLVSDVQNMSETDLLDLCAPEDRISMKSFLSSWLPDPIIIWGSDVLKGNYQSLEEFLESITVTEKPHVVSLILSNNNLSSSDITCFHKYLIKSQYPRLGLLNMKGNNVKMEDLLWLKKEYPHIIILTDTVDSNSKRPPVWPSSTVTSDSEDYC
jgi:hypothetical protein